MSTDDPLVTKVKDNRITGVRWEIILQILGDFIEDPSTHDRQVEITTVCFELINILAQMSFANGYIDKPTLDLIVERLSKIGTST